MAEGVKNAATTFLSLVWAGGSSDRNMVSRIREVRIGSQGIGGLWKSVSRSTATASAYVVTTASPRRCWGALNGGTSGGKSTPTERIPEPKRRVTTSGVAMFSALRDWRVVIRPEGSGRRLRSVR